jgi:hypothetical protein
VSVGSLSYYRLLIARSTFTITTAWVFKLSNNHTIGIAIYSSTGILLGNGSASTLDVGYNSIPMTPVSSGSLNIYACTLYYIGFYGTISGTALMSKILSVTNIPVFYLFSLPSWTSISSPPSTITISSGVQTSSTIWYAFGNT